MLSGVHCIGGCDRRLSRSCRSRDQGAAAPYQSAADQAVEAFYPTLVFFRFKVLLMHGRDQGRKNLETAAANDKIVKALPDCAAPQLHNPQAPPARSISARDLFKADHTVRDALKLRVKIGRASCRERV